MIKRTPNKNRAHPATVWLYATDPEHLPALAVLAEQLRDFTAPPEIVVSRAGDDLSPASDDVAAIDAFLTRHAVQMLVVAGAYMPVTVMDRARAHGAAMFLVDAKHPIVPGRWRIGKGHTRSVLSRFAQIHAQDAQAATALTRLMRGQTAVFETGRLARFFPAAACNTYELEAMRRALGTRPVWFAYDLPVVETDAALLAHAHALRRAHRLLLILRPRDLEQGAVMAARSVDLGFVTARRANEEDIDESTQVYVADTDDDPGLFLRMAPVSFLGGSLTADCATSSAVNAAALGSALVFGPHNSGGDKDFLDRLGLAGGGRQIGVAPALGGALAALLAPDVGASAALKAWTLATEGSDATNAVARAIIDWLQLNRGRE